MESALHERLQAVAGARTYRAIAELTGTNSETVRRYLQGQTPSVEFLASLCRVFGVNGEWLLCGRGPMRAEDVRTHALKEASGGELLGAMATAIERLTDRVERLEVYTQTLETRIRGRENLAAGLGGAGVGAVGGSEVTSTERTDEQAKTPAVEAARRARRVADAVAERSRANAD